MACSNIMAWWNMIRALLLCILISAVIIGINWELSITPTTLQKPHNFFNQYTDMQEIISRYTTNSSYQASIIRASLKYQVDVALICAIITTESNWDSLAVSSVGAMGLMQVMPSTMALMKKANLINTQGDLFNSTVNIDIGTAILKHELSKFPVEAALAAYNGGHKNGKLYAMNHLEKLPEETRQYVPKVMSLL